MTNSLQFNSANHQYTIEKDGKRIRVPSVTTILSVIDKSGPLMGWAINNTNSVWLRAIQPDTTYTDIYLEQVASAAKKASREIKGEAANVGKEAHRIIQECLQAPEGERPVLPTEENPIGKCVNAAFKWMGEHSFRVREVERIIYSQRYGYSGTLDCIAEVDGELALIDWKSSNQVYPEFWFQTAAYQNAFQEETSERIRKRYLVRLGKEDGAFDVHESSLIKQYRTDLKAFLAALQLYHALKSRGKNE